MKDLKSTFISILKALYRQAIITFFLFFLLANQYFVNESFFKKRAYKSSLDPQLVDRWLEFLTYHSDE